MSTRDRRADAGSLRQVLQAARAPGVSMTDLTVLAAQNDPYRVDTPAGHRDGAWFAEQFHTAGRSRLHLRALHYAIISAEHPIPKPDGKPYTNTDADWTWLQSRAAKCGRWLGYVPFEAITDERNDPPIIRETHRGDPEPYVSIGLDIEIPGPDDIEPYVGCIDFEGRQPYRLVLWGEKSSIREVLEPLALRYDADLFTPTGEISDTLMHRMATIGAEDGRPMRVFTISDCDPAGYQMPISVARKLQALRDLLYPDLDFEVRPVALTVDQVRELDLPSTPLKETELRADRWRDAFGVEQTEIDALGTLRPDVLRKLVRDAVEPFFDPTLQGRVWHAKNEWTAEAQAELDAHLDAGILDTIRDQAVAKLAELEAEIETLNKALRQTVPMNVLLPPVVIPDPVINESLHGTPLVSSSWSWAEQTRRLIERKSYGNGAGHD
jgi:hypothetical protein